MRILYVKQPWAYAIIHQGKTIENRRWATHYRGPLLIAASKEPDRHGLAEWREREPEIDTAMEYGGIIGIVDLVDCVTSHKSKWFEGPIGWVLKSSRPISLIPMQGQRGLFEPPPNIKTKLKKLGFQ